MGKQELTKVISVEYDVDTTNIIKQPDLQLLEKFVKDGTHDNMCITYENHGECSKRRMCLRTWLNKSDYKDIYYTSIRENKLYILKERSFENDIDK